MSKQHHYLKCEVEFYQAIEKGEKKFELRKNDRDFQKHDIVHLQETMHGEYTGRKMFPIEIKYILVGGMFGLDMEFCIFNW